MKKEKLIEGCVKFIKRIAIEKELKYENMGTGHGFDNTIWNFKDNSEIPTVKAFGKGYVIEFCPILGASPEISIRRDSKNGEELLVVRWSDLEKSNDGEEYHNTGEYSVYEVTVCSKNYKKVMSDLYYIISEVEK